MENLLVSESLRKHRAHLPARMRFPSCDRTSDDRPRPRPRHRVPPDYPEGDYVPVFCSKCGSKNRQDDGWLPQRPPCSAHPMRRRWIAGIRSALWTSNRRRLMQPPKMPQLTYECDRCRDEHEETQAEQTEAQAEEQTQQTQQTAPAAATAVAKQQDARAGNAAGRGFASLSSPSVARPARLAEKLPSRWPCLAPLVSRGCACVAIRHPSGHRALSRRKTTPQSNHTEMQTAECIRPELRIPSRPR